ncbi:MAG: hypothetical protein QM813_24410, partial [Verrucomicrobiota bacterium]
TVANVQLVADYDDGFIAWINGVEIARTNVNGQPTNLTNATVSIEPSRTNTFAFAALPQTYLVEGQTSSRCRPSIKASPDRISVLTPLCRSFARRQLPSPTSFQRRARQSAR